MKVTPVVWQFGTDYPGAQSDDAKLPIGNVMLKAFDGAVWQGTYDKHALAIRGAASIAKLVKLYNAQGIGVYLWCVPKGSNVAGQLQLAKVALDVPGVKGLFMDVEPYAGFCAGSCPALATSFMAALRSARPNKYLGVIFDPRPQHWAPSGTRAWLSKADAAAPMLYWRTFAGQGVWGDPVLGLRQTRTDLTNIGFKGHYVPMLQGDSPAADMTRALGEAKRVSAAQVTIWRRGVVPLATWQAIADVAAPAPPVPAGPRYGALVKWPDNHPVYTVGRDGKKHHVNDGDTERALGVSPVLAGNDAEKAMPVGLPIHAVDAVALRRTVAEMRVELAKRTELIKELQEAGRANAADAASWHALSRIMRGLLGL